MMRQEACARGQIKTTCRLTQRAHAANSPTSQLNFDPSGMHRAASKHASDHTQSNGATALVVLLNDRDRCTRLRTAAVTASICSTRWGAPSSSRHSSSSSDVCGSRDAPIIHDVMRTYIMCKSRNGNCARRRTLAVCYTRTQLVGQRVAAADCICKRVRARRSWGGERGTRG